MHGVRQFALLGVLGIGWIGRPAPAAAQRLTLAEAMERAAESGYGVRMADAEARAARADAMRPLRGILPTLRVEGGYVRTTDPLGAFGAVLRQRAVTPEAFDPARLNTPEAVGTMGTGLVLEQPLFNADALAGRRAATRAAAAAEAGAVWAAAEGRLDALAAFYRAVLASEQIGALDSAVRAARAHQRQAEAMLRQGLVTRSDALLAAARTGDLEARLTGAQGAAAVARRALGVTLGAGAATEYTLPARLPAMESIRALAAAGPAQSAERADVRAARLALEAARLDAARATTLLLPRVNAFGRLDWNHGDTPFGGAEAWTAGVMVSWSPFSGGDELAQRAGATARRSVAAAAVDAAAAAAELDALQAAAELDAALARMDATAAAVDQTAEAHRIMARQYAAGLVSVAELLSAAAEESGARLGHADAKYQAIVALGRRERAAGATLDRLAGLDEEGD